jgi:hypothetical protein
MQSSQSPGFRRQDIKDAAGASLSVLLLLCVCVCARRKEINGQSISFNPPGIDIYIHSILFLCNRAGGGLYRKENGGF